MFDPIVLLSLIVFTPAIAALAIAFFPANATEPMRWLTLAATIVVLLLVIVGFLVPGQPTAFEVSEAAGQMQSAFNQPWIPSFDIDYFMGIDGISLPLVVLTAAISVLAMGASWSIKKHVKSYCILFLLLETGMLGVFVSLDFFLFYVFWEVMLLPMYFLIGVWGGPRREYAAIKFFLYTLVGGVLMLIAILMLYFTSDLRELAAVSDVNGNTAAAVQWEDLHLSEAVKAKLDSENKVHTFNLVALAALAQHTDVFNQEMLFGWTVQHWAFLLLLIGFIIKLPSVPVHTWLPDAHVEAPTPISMILAGVLLKMGGYGILRICYPICPLGGQYFAWLVCGLGVISMIYGGLAALAQKDFKRLVAYSSVSHMGYVLLGFGVWGAFPEAWNMGIKGAMFQMIGHGVSSAGMFFMVGVVYDRVHHRNLAEFGGLFGKMPVYTALSMGLFFAALGLPGLCGFVGEFFVVLSVWEWSRWAAVAAAIVVVLTAGYILWTIQRVYLGAEYRGPHEEELHPLNVREFAIAATLFVAAIVLGVFPWHTTLRYMDATIDRQVTELEAWKQRNLALIEGESEGAATAAKNVGDNALMAASR